LPSLVTGFDLSEFIASAELAFPHFEALSSNTSLIYSWEVRARETLIYETFNGIADDYTSGGSLEESISAHSEGIDEIADHLLAISESWHNAGLALESILHQESPSPIQIIVPIGGGALIAVIAIAFYTVRSRKVD
jgi:hypothetical protein